MSKGSRDRTANFRQKDANHDRINWASRSCTWTHRRGFWHTQCGNTAHDEFRDGGGRCQFCGLVINTQESDK